MKTFSSNTHRTTLLLSLLLAVSTLSSAQGSKASNGVPRVVVNILVDQLRSDYLEAFMPLYGEDGFKKLLNEAFEAESGEEWDKKLADYLIADEADENSSNDFGKNIIPAMLAAGEKMYAYSFEGYWKDVGTIDSLWEANMDILADPPAFELNDNNWKIYSRFTSVF